MIYGQCQKQQSCIIFVATHNSKISKVQRTVINVFKLIKITVRCTLRTLDCLLATNIEVLCTFLEIKIPIVLVRKFGMIHVFAFILRGLIPEILKFRHKLRSNPSGYFQIILSILSRKPFIILKISKTSSSSAEKLLLMAYSFLSKTMNRQLFSTI